MCQPGLPLPSWVSQDTSPSASWHSRPNEKQQAHRQANKITPVDTARDSMLEQSRCAYFERLPEREISGAALLGGGVKGHTALRGSRFKPFYVEAS